MAVPVYLFPASSPYFNGALSAAYPDVSAATGSIVFAGQQQNGSGINTISVTTDGGVTVTDLYTASALLIFPVSPSYSQNGTKIVFSEWDQTTVPNATFNIYTMDADGSNRVLVWTDTSGVFFGASQFPRFNPAGTKIIYQIRDATATYDIFNVMNVDGTGNASFLDLSGATTSVREPDWAVDNLLLFTRDNGVALTFSTCDNTGSGVLDITLDWGGDPLVELTNPRRFWGGTTFWFLSDDDTLVYFMSAGVDGTGTTVIVSNDGSAPAPQNHFGIGVFDSGSNFIITVDEFTLSSIDTTPPRIPICRILYGLGV